MSKFTDVWTNPFVQKLRDTIDRINISNMKVIEDTPTGFKVSDKKAKELTKLFTELEKMLE